MTARANGQIRRQRCAAARRLATIPVPAAVDLGMHGQLVELVIRDEQDTALARVHAVGSRDRRPYLNLDVLAAVANRNPVLGAEAG